MFARSANPVEMDFSMIDVPPMLNGLVDGDPIQAFVSAWASQAIQLYRASKVAPSTTTTATERPTQRLKRLSLHRTRRRSNKDAMACPFYKRNPKLYQACGYAVSIPKASVARHHVVIHHHAPIYCAVCHARFPSAVERDEHERSRSCNLEERIGEPIEGVTPDLVPKLLQRGESKGRRRMHENDQENWFKMWDILFPGVERPQTAYLSSPEEREIVALRQFWERAGPTVVRGLLGKVADDATLQAVQASILEKMVEQAEYGAALVLR